MFQTFIAKTGEVVVYSDYIMKFNRVQRRQERVLLMTDQVCNSRKTIFSSPTALTLLVLQAIYNFVPRKYTKWKRRILLQDLDA